MEVKWKICRKTFLIKNYLKEKIQQVNLNLYLKILIEYSDDAQTKKNNFIVQLSPFTLDIEI